MACEPLILNLVVIIIIIIIIIINSFVKTDLRFSV